MEKITEILIGSLSLGEPEERRAMLIDKINGVIRPPRQATVDNVNIRAMYVVNDLINSHGGQFRREDITKISELIIDTPVLVGHNRSETPLARTFYAELEQKGDVLWLKSYFYWPKISDNAQDDLLLKIDSGVLKECSISFTYTFPECSICGADIRKCPHELAAGASHFIYNGITQVLETSLVYKGSVKGTYITDKLAAIQPDQKSIDKAQIDNIALSKCLKDSGITIIPIAISDSLGKVLSNQDKLSICRANKDKRPFILVRQKEAGVSSHA